jgi:hypothetical protein
MLTIRDAAGVLLGALIACSWQAWAIAPADLQKTYEAASGGSEPSFGGFSARRGEQFFKSTHGAEWSCSSCHTENPKADGKHAKTGKMIAPLAPAANPERFTDAVKVEKWFKRNCNDVVGRLCSAREKGDVIAFLLSLK